MELLLDFFSFRGYRLLDLGSHLLDRNQVLNRSLVFVFVFADQYIQELFDGDSIVLPVLFLFANDADESVLGAILINAYAIEGLPLMQAPFGAVKVLEVGN